MAASISTGLKHALDARSWTPAHLAAAMADAGDPITEQTAIRWLRGGGNPRAAQLPMLARVLGITTDELLGALPVEFAA